MQHLEVTKIKENGLRYQSKTNGSPFGTAIGQSLSCIKCGNHRPRGLLKQVMLAGTRQYRCKESCGKAVSTVEAVPTSDGGVEL